MENKFVCASDGKTYTNECLFQVESCRSQRDLKIIHHGDCSLNLNPCQNLSCSFHEVCEINEHGIASCVCPKSCPLVMRPVCGSDEITYESVCDLERNACISKSNTTIHFFGPCDSKIHLKCRLFNCNFYSFCTIDSKTNKPFCQCPSFCTEEYSPVCGSDGISYGNICKMRRESCQKKKRIVMSYQGLCGMYYFLFHLDNP